MCAMAEGSGEADKSGGKATQIELAEEAVRQHQEGAINKVSEQ